MKSYNFLLYADSNGLFSRWNRIFLFNQTSSLNMYYYVNMDRMENNSRLHGKYKYFMQPGIIYYN